MRKQFIPLLAAGLAVASLLTAPVAAFAAPTFIFDSSGNTTLNIEDFTVSIYTYNIHASKIGSATTQSGTTYTFPVIGGAVDSATIQLEAVNVGGMKFQNGTDTLALNSPIVNTTGSQAIMTFLVTINGNLQGRYALFDLKTPDYAKPQSLANGDAVHANNIRVTLSQVGANTFNSTFNVNLPVGTTVGTLKIKSTLGQKLPQ
jgi:hypothetical protein